ncbi:MAG: hypothetical protein AAFU78_21660 [Cyanobacteria bacterium J06633_2]
MNLLSRLRPIEVRPYNPEIVIWRARSLHGAVTLNTIAAVFRHEYTTYERSYKSIRWLFDDETAEELFHIIRKRADGASSPHIEQIYNIYRAQQLEKVKERAIA